MIEGANRAKEVAAHLIDLGYLYADRDGDVVRLNSEMSSAINGYWIHPSRREMYEQIGLLIGD